MVDEKIKLAEGKYYAIDVNYGELTFSSIDDATAAYKAMSKAVGVKTYFDKRAQASESTIKLRSMYLWDVDNFCEQCSTGLDNCTCKPDDAEEEV